MWPLPANFDDGQGAPGVNESSQWAMIGGGEENHQYCDERNIYQNESRLHPEDTLRKRGHGQEDHLHHRRVDRGELLIVDALVRGISQVL